MSAPESREYELLLAAHGNRELTGDEARRLRELAGEDPVRCAEVEAFDVIHAGFAAERELMRECASPADPGEEADESYQRMQRAAANASESLRDKLVNETPAAIDLPVARRRRIGGVMMVAAAALVVTALVFAFGGGGKGRPALDPSIPDGRVLGQNGPAKIGLSPELRALDPVISWQAVAGARTYEAVFEDGQGAELLRRSSEFEVSTTWRLSEADFARLRDVEGEVLLRIVGVDGAGNVVGTSGDLPVTLVR